MRTTHFLIPAAVLTVFGLALVLFPGCGSQGPRVSSVNGVSVKPFRDEGAARDALYLVNQERTARGMQPLTRRGDLDAVAYAHARDLMRMNQLNHVSSDGRRLENRLERLDWEWAGENLARNKGYDAPAREAVKGWVASPKHYENMFKPDFSQTGVAALYDPDSGFTYFVQVFIIPVS